MYNFNHKDRWQSKLFLPKCPRIKKLLSTQMKCLITNWIDERDNICSNDLYYNFEPKMGIQG